MPTLNTDGSSLTDISGYRVLYGTNPTTLSQSVQVSDPGVTSQTITGLPAGTYYFSVVSLNSTGAASTPTSVASKTVP